jgi:hypothetical protein
VSGPPCFDRGCMDRTSVRATPRIHVRTIKKSLSLSEFPQ